MTAPLGGVAWTPGPWSIHADLYIASADAFAVAKVPEFSGLESDTRQANARLIAAAPDMFAALNVILKVVPRKQLEKAMNLSGETPYDIATAAAAKATGAAK